MMHSVWRRPRTDCRSILETHIALSFKVLLFRMNEWMRSKKQSRSYNSDGQFSLELFLVQGNQLWLLLSAVRPHSLPSVSILRGNFCEELGTLLYLKEIWIIKSFCASISTHICRLGLVTMIRVYCTRPARNETASHPVFTGAETWKTTALYCTASHELRDVLNCAARQSLL